MTKEGIDLCGVGWAHIGLPFTSLQGYNIKATGFGGIPHVIEVTHLTTCKQPFCSLRLFENEQG
jgi:hypothetical protein